MSPVALREGMSRLAPSQPILHRINVTIERDEPVVDVPSTLAIFYDPIREKGSLPLCWWHDVLIG